MAVRPEMVNEAYSPNDQEERVLEFLKTQPCGRVTNRYVREQTGLPAERVDPALNNLETAGWVRRLTRGFYELVEDPREETPTRDNQDKSINVSEDVWERVHARKHAEEYDDVDGVLYDLLETVGVE